MRVTLSLCTFALDNPWVFRIARRTFFYSLFVALFVFINTLVAQRDSAEFPAGPKSNRRYAERK